MKIRMRYLILLLLGLVACGCAPPSARKNVDGLATDQYSIIRSENNNVTIRLIDGERSVGFLTFLFYGKWAGEASLDPGEHKFNIAYEDGHKKSLYLFKLSMLSGHAYIIKHQIVNNGISLWLEDQGTKEVVGKIIASTNEPITNRNFILDHSDYFTFTAPQGEGWIVAYRNKYQTALAKEGLNTDETYAINIILFELPNFSSKEEFVNYVRTGRERDTNSNRFKIINNELDSLSGEDKYCVSYHTISEDKEAVKRSSNNDPMLLEMVGNICRLPQNKNMAITNDYSHRYYPNHQDVQLKDKASKAFQSLKF